ncbi:MAG: hypothetical protein U5Q44_05030 [Dehalococcoidia bacterium]|nr:hypothetical protein [Dehalococcoidia bacterium]
MSHGGDGASAQGFPPDPPLVVHGDAPGSDNGQSVHVLVNDGSLWTWCGVGGVVDGSYVVQVAADNQTEGCGASGRTISLYFAPEGQYAGEGGRDATSTFSWQSSLEAPLDEDVTLGDTYTVRGMVPQVSGQVDN